MAAFAEGFADDARTFTADDHGSPFHLQMDLAIASKTAGALSSNGGHVHFDGVLPHGAHTGR
jgi:hypothetical protein